MKNKNRGITLIALAVTIIVMLILAGATMSVLTGDSGIITNAKKSKKESERAAAQEAADLLYAEMLQNNYKGDLTEEDITKNVLNELKDQGYSITQANGSESNITGINLSTSSLLLKKGESGSVTVNFIRGEGKYYLQIGKEYYLIIFSEDEGVQISKESENIKTNGSLIKDNDITSTNSKIVASIKGETITVKGNDVGVGKITVKYGDFETTCNIQVYSETEDKANFIEAKDIADSTDKSEYYGQYVEGYNTKPNYGWEIFHADDENIYLIAGLHNDTADNLPQKNGKSMIQSGWRAQYWSEDIMNQYPKGLGTIASQNEKVINKWLKKYTETQNFKNGQDKNSRVAYMLDTEIWNKLYLIDGLADYAIGGPTMEMFVDSWNSVHGDNKKIQCMVVQNNDDYGYVMKNVQNDSSYKSSINIEADEKYKNIYQLDSTAAALAMWIASPGGYGENSAGIMVITRSGYWISNTLGFSTDNKNCGFRPIVCLSKGIKLKRLDNGNFQIVGTE